MKKHNPYDPIDVDAELFMEHPEEKQFVFDQVNKAGAGLAELLFNFDTPKKIEATCKKYELVEAQAVALSRLIRRVVIAQEYFGDLISLLSEQLDIHEIKARQLANTIVEELFKTSMSDIKKLQVEAFSDRIKGASVVDLRNKTS